MKPTFIDKFWKTCLIGRSELDLINSFNQATMNGEIWRANYLLENKNINIDQDNGFALRWASHCGRLPMVKFLLNEGADIHCDKDAAIIYAARQGKVDIVKYLIKSGIDKYTQNGEALMVACENGHLEMVQYLLENGLNSSKYRQNAQKRTNGKKNPEICKILNYYTAPNNNATPPSMHYFPKG